MTEGQRLPQRQNGQTPPSAVPRRVGLKWKIIGGLAAGIIAFSLLALAVVHYQMSRVFRSDLERRALDIATNLADGAATHLSQGNIPDLYALVTRYSFLPGVAYALIRDQKGTVIAHSPGTPPAVLSETSAPDARELPQQRGFALQGSPVYETTAAILEGPPGNVSVAVWAESLKPWVRHAVLPLVGLLVGALAAGLALTIFLTRGIARRALRLKEVADRVSMGDLETAVGIESNDEIGDIACSVERMRASLKAAMARLSRT